MASITRSVRAVVGAVMPLVVALPHRSGLAVLQDVQRDHPAVRVLILRNGRAGHQRKAEGDSSTPRR